MPQVKKGLNITTFSFLTFSAVHNSAYNRCLHFEHDKMRSWKDLGVRSVSSLLGLVIGFRSFIQLVLVAAKLTIGALNKLRNIISSITSHRKQENQQTVCTANILWISVWVNGAERPCKILVPPIIKLIPFGNRQSLQHKTCYGHEQSFQHTTLTIITFPMNMLVIHLKIILQKYFSWQIILPMDCYFSFDQSKYFMLAY